MAGAGFGRGMALIALGEHDPLRQPLQAAAIILAIFAEQIGGKLIDADCDDQLRRAGGCRRGRRLCRNRHGGGQQQGGGDMFQHFLYLLQP